MSVFRKFASVMRQISIESNHYKNNINLKKYFNKHIHIL
jgi:hypothetical protein